MRLYLTICFFLLTMFTWSQENTIMLGVGTGMNVNRILDEYHSPMTYRGNGYMLQAGLTRQKNRYYEQLAIIFQKSKIRPDIRNNSAAHLYLGSINWIRTYQLKSKSEKWRTYLGFHLFTNYDVSSHSEWTNNGYTHCLAVNSGPSLVLDYAPWTKDIHFFYELSIPVLNYIIRPSLGSIIPEGSISRSNKDVWGLVSGGDLTSLHKYQRMCSTLYMSLRDSRGFNIRFGYQWNYQNYTVNNNYQTANHLLFLAVYFQIKA